MRNVTVCLLATLSAVSSLAGCSAAAPAPAQSAPSTEAAVAAPRAAAAAAPDAAPQQSAPEAAQPQDSPPADESRDGLRKASRPPLELLTGNNVVYVFNFGGSAKGEAAKVQCESQADAHAIRDCLAAERAKIPVESSRFVKDAHGQYWWVTYNSYKGNLLKWHRVQFLPGKQDADTISLTLVGKDKGIAPMAHVPASLTIELPNDYSIVVRDPEHGQMLFDAKIGLMDKDGG